MNVISRSFYLHQVLESVTSISASWFLHYVKIFKKSSAQIWSFQPNFDYCACWKNSRIQKRSLKTCHILNFDFFKHKKPNNAKKISMPVLEGCEESLNINRHFWQEIQLVPINLHFSKAGPWTDEGRSWYKFWPHSDDLTWVCDIDMQANQHSLEFKGKTSHGRQNHTQNCRNYETTIH